MKVLRSARVTRVALTIGVVATALGATVANVGFVPTALQPDARTLTVRRSC